MTEIGDDGTIMRALTKIYWSILAFSLFTSFLLGVFFAPVSAEAGFFSSIFGDAVYAQVDPADSIQSNKNSQTMELLQANVSSASLFQDKSKKKEDVIDQNMEVNIISNSALLAIGGPM